MSSRASTQPSNRPLRAIELPREMRVLVAQLNKVETQLSPDDLYAMRTQGPLALRRQLQAQLVGGWFHAESIAQRMNYIDHDAPQSSAAAP
jgi:hypothetical protein